ncbi:Serine/threonine protein kinase [Planctomycetales bacterium 10988]|nr:Serine/threonine protein kinase [Planctomycetales bacterium 10988]
MASLPALPSLGDLSETPPEGTPTPQKKDTVKDLPAVEQQGASSDQAPTSPPAESPASDRKDQARRRNKKSTIPELQAIAENDTKSHDPPAAKPAEPTPTEQKPAAQRRNKKSTLPLTAIPEQKEPEKEKRGPGNLPVRSLQNRDRDRSQDDSKKPGTIFEDPRGKQGEKKLSRRTTIDGDDSKTVVPKEPHPPEAKEPPKPDQPPKKENNSRTIISQTHSGSPAQNKSKDIPTDPDEIRRSVAMNWAEALGEGELVDKEDRPKTSTITQKAKKTMISRSSVIVKPRRIADPQKSADAPDYEIQEVLGEGGMGIVYLARQTAIDRTIAIKMLKPGMADDPGLRLKFLTEAAVTGDLDHPNIVPIHDLGESENGSIFYAMKRVRGTPWDEVIQEKSLDENLETLLRVGDAIGFAHARGVIHRDLKPENVMLGNFGEVLVMDWGLALGVTAEGKAEEVESAESMCGSPAYMAPEMATGPIHKIGTGSDIYLLGAILYEVIGGIPPHYGDTTLNCLFAAGMNKIEPIEAKGELLDIALKAMATQPEERYESVKDFQTAIRDYQSHSESILLADKAQTSLELAQHTDSYDDFAKAMFGFSEAASLWSGNEDAIQGELVARQRYAEAAFRKHDLDLAESLLLPEEPLHQTLLAEVVKERKERIARQRTLRYTAHLIRAMAVLLLIVMVGAFLWVRSERDSALDAKREADISRGVAEEQRQKALAQKSIADEQRAKALEEQKKAEQEKQNAEEQKEIAEEQKLLAEKQKLLADEKTEEAEESAQAALDAQQQAILAQRSAEYEAYVAKIGLAAANISDNGFGQAFLQLESANPDLRNWEWGRLRYLTNLHERVYSGEGRIQSLGVSPDNQRFVTAEESGHAHVWDMASGETLLTLPHFPAGVSANVRAALFSPTQEIIATAGDDSTIKLWNSNDGTLIKTLEGHDNAVLCLAFSHDGKRLVSGGADSIAILWEVESGKEIRKFEGHTNWIWSVQFSPDDERLVTASQEGTATVWPVEQPKEDIYKAAYYSNKYRYISFAEHNGAVYAASFTPDGKHIITGGYDKTARIWDSSSGEEVRVLQGHFGRVTSVAISPDGTEVATGSRDNTTKIWNFKTGANLKTLRGHASSVNVVRYLDSDDQLLTGSNDATAKLWKLADYHEYYTLNGHQNEILSATFSHHGSFVATGSLDRSARLWNARNGELIHSFQEGHTQAILAVSYHPNGKQALSASEGGTIRIWNLEESRQVRVIKAHDAAVASALYSPDGKWIASAGDDEKIKVWDAATGELITTIDEHRGGINALAFSPDSKLLLSGDSNSKARIWRWQDRQMLQEFSQHSKPITACAFSPDQRFALTASEDRVVGIWEVQTGREVGTLAHDRQVTALAVSRDGSQVLTGTQDAEVHLWDFRRREKIHTMQGHEGRITSVDFSPQGTQALTAGGKDAKLWDLKAGKLIKTLQSPSLEGTYRYSCWSARFGPDDTTLLTGGELDVILWDAHSGDWISTMAPQGAVSGLAFTPDDRFLVTASWDGTLKVWNTDTGYLETSLKSGHLEYINSVAISPLGNLMVTSANDGTAVIYQYPSGKILRKLEGHLGRIKSAVFSPDGRWVLTTSSDRTAKLWNSASGKLVETFTGHEGAVLAGVFSSDVHFILTGSEDGTARLWHIDSARELMVYRGHTASVTSVAFAPMQGRAAEFDVSKNGRQRRYWLSSLRVITGSEDLTAKIWDSSTGKEILTLRGHTLEITAVGFSPNGDEALTASRDQTAIIWPSLRWSGQDIRLSKQ